MRVSDQAAQMAKLDHAMDEPAQKARELADTCDALAQLEDTVTLYIIESSRAYVSNMSKCLKCLKASKLVSCAPFAKSVTLTGADNVG